MTVSLNCEKIVDNSGEIFTTTKARLLKPGTRLFFPVKNFGDMMTEIVDDHLYFRQQEENF